MKADYPSLQLLQVFPGNPQIIPVVETGILTSGFHLPLLFSNSVPQSHPHPFSRHLLWLLPPLCPMSSGPHSSSPPFILLLELPGILGQAFSRKPPAKSAGEARTAEQAGKFWIFTLPFLLQIPSLVPSSAVDYLLWSLLTLCLHSQGNKQIMMEHLSFLPPVSPLIFPHHNSSHSCVSVPNT